MNVPKEKNPLYWPKDKRLAESTFTITPNYDGIMEKTLKKTSIARKEFSIGRNRLLGQSSLQIFK